MGPAGTLFGYNGFTSSGNFLSYAISAAGVTKLFDMGGLIGNSPNIHYHQGRVYGDSGAVVDVANPAQPVRIGRFPFRGLITARSSSRMLMLTEGATQGSLQLRILETENFTQVASLAIGTTFLDIGSVSGLVYLGGDGVAFLAPSQGAKSLFILRSPMIGAAPSDDDAEAGFPPGCVHRCRRMLGLRQSGSGDGRNDGNRRCQRGDRRRRNGGCRGRGRDHGGRRSGRGDGRSVRCSRCNGRGGYGGNDGCSRRERRGGRRRRPRWCDGDGRRGGRGW